MNFRERDYLLSAKNNQNVNTQNVQGTLIIEFEFINQPSNKIKEVKLFYYLATKH